MVAPAYQPQFCQQPTQQYTQQHQQPQQQARPQFNNNNRVQRTPYFNPIPMSYAKLFSTLLAKNHIQTRYPLGVEKRARPLEHARFSLTLVRGGPRI